MLYLYKHARLVSIASGLFLCMCATISILSSPFLVALLPETLWRIHINWRWSIVTAPASVIVLTILFFTSCDARQHYWWGYSGAIISLLASGSTLLWGLGMSYMINHPR